MRNVIIASITATLLCACQKDHSAELYELRAEVASLKSSLELTNATLAAQAVSKTTRPKAAILDPVDNGYSSMETTIGSMLLSLKDIKPLADGSQVSLQVGNPYAVSLLGIKLQVAYGARQKADQDYATWSNSLRIKEVSIPAPIYSGSWNTVTFALPAKPQEVGYLAVTGDIDRVSLTPR